MPNGVCIQALSQDFESGSPNFLGAEGRHSMAPVGGLGGMPPENFEKLKPLRRDFSDSRQL